jgi:hypothetical protein
MCRSHLRHPELAASALVAERLSDLDELGERLDRVCTRRGNARLQMLDSSKVVDGGGGDFRGAPFVCEIGCVVGLQGRKCAGARKSHGRRCERRSIEMMRLNAIRYGPRLAADIVAAGRAASHSDVISLLRSNRRERVMGAWFVLLLGRPFGDRGRTPSPEHLQRIAPIDTDSNRLHDFADSQEDSQHRDSPPWGLGEFRQGVLHKWTAIVLDRPGLPRGLLYGP